MKSQKIIITMPAYNEEKTIGGVMEDINKVMSSSKYKDNYSILVVNDGSSDATEKIAKRAGAIVISHQTNYGLAETFRTEMRECLRLDADIIVHTDADGQYPAKFIPQMINEVINGSDLVLGSRFDGKIESMPLLKKMGNMAFSKVLSKITRLRISDGQTGFRAFKRAVAEKVTINSTFTYTQEQIIKAVREKFWVKEIPIYFAIRGGNTKSRLMRNPIDFAMRAGINLLRIERDYNPLKFFGFIGAVFFTIGAIIGMWFTYIHFFAGGIKGHIGLIMLMIILLMMGIQTMIFGFMADMNRK